MTPPSERVPERAAPGNRRSWDPWGVAAAAFTLLAARWLQDPSLPLLGAAVATLALVVWRTLRDGRVAGWRRRAALVVAAVTFIGIGAEYHRRAAALDREATVVASEREAAAGAALASAFSAVGDELIRTARRAIDVPAERGAAFDALAPLARGAEDRAVILAKSGSPFAWAGRLVAPMDSLPGPLGVIATPFYIVAYAVASEGERFAVASVLIHAERPGDQLSRALDERLAATHGVDGFVYGGAASAADVPGAVVLSLGGEPLLAARAIVPPVDALRLEARERSLPRATLMLGIVGLLLLAIAWRRGSGIGRRLIAFGAAFAAVAMVPLNALSNLSPWFDPSFYVVPSGGRLTANAGALAIASALLLLGLLSALRARTGPRSQTQALIGVLLAAGLGPFLLRELARGIQVPTIGVPTGLWVAWQVTLFLAAVTVLLVGVASGHAALGDRRGLGTWVAPAIAALAALSAPLVLEAPGRLPALHPLLWIAAIGALAFTRRARATVLPVAFVAACGAVTLVWFSTVRDRVELARNDVAGLDTPDPAARTLLERYAGGLDPATAARSRVDLLVNFAGSELAGSDFPIEIATWAPDGAPMAELRVGRGPGVTAGVNILALEAQRQRRMLLREAPGEPGMYVVLGLPHIDGTVTTAVLAPRTALVASDAFGAFLGFRPPPEPEPPYTLRLSDAPSLGPLGQRAGSWVRMGAELHGDWTIAAAGGMTRSVHATVDLRSFDALLMRGALMVLLDLAMLGAVWLLIVSADGALRRWWRLRRRDVLQSYRARLSVALFAAFVVPSVLFGLWSLQRVQADDRAARDLVVKETLRGVAVSTDTVELAAISKRFDTPLFLYANGLLVGTSDPLLDALAPVGRLLPAGVVRTLDEGDEPTAGRAEGVGPAAVRLGYRAVTDGGVQYVLATPARLDERLLDRRRNDLAVFVLFALALGGLVAVLVSEAGSRQLSRPIRELQVSALALARGEQPPALTEDPPVEFTPVFSAFRQMTADLAESRSALEAAERRLVATLRNVASGVVAVDDAGRVMFANPRAEEILDEPLPAGAAFDQVLDAELAARLAAFREGAEDDATFELDRAGRRLQVRVARLARGVQRVVVTLDDVTEVTRAERVLAWGEMARQVAHEIKNPLTPIRLGMQHLLRARRDGRVDFDQVLEENTARVLAEIDRLDEIARAFSRYGSPPVAEAPSEAVDVAKVARDLLELERMGAEGIVWDADIPDGPLMAAARERELREVLLNLLENARLARARRIALSVEGAAGGGAVIRVVDDGGGIPPHLLDRIFEPHFSTRTSGSGLGLAISRRLIEGWGGAIAAESVAGRGTTLTVWLAPVPTASITSDGDAFP